MDSVKEVPGQAVLVVGEGHASATVNDLVQALDEKGINGTVIVGSEDKEITTEQRQEMLKKLIDEHQLKNRMTMGGDFKKSSDTWVSPTRSPFKSLKSRIRNKIKRKTQQQMRRKG